MTEQTDRLREFAERAHRLGLHIHEYADEIDGAAPVPPVVPPPVSMPAPGTFAAELKAALEAGHMYRLAGHATLNQPIVATINTTLDRRAWGIDGGDWSITASGFSGPAITVVYNTTSRGFCVDELTLRGGGLHLIGAGNLYGSSISAFRLESIQGHGLHLEGAVFESQILDGFVGDCSGDGLRFEHSQSGRVCSAMHVWGVDSVQNGRGLAIERFARDVVLDACYFRDNRGPGCFLSNGHDRQWTALGFENNGKADPAAPHILANNNLILHGSAFHDAVDIGRYAIRVQSVSSNPSAIVDCRRSRGKGVNAHPMVQVVRGHGMGPH